MGSAYSTPDNTTKKTTQTRHYKPRRSPSSTPSRRRVPQRTDVSYPKHRANKRVVSAGRVVRKKKSESALKNDMPYDPYNARYIKRRQLGNGAETMFVVGPDGRTCHYAINVPGYSIYRQHPVQGYQPMHFVPMYSGGMYSPPNFGHCGHWNHANAHVQQQQPTHPAFVYPQQQPAFAYPHRQQAQQQQQPVRVPYLKRAVRNIEQRYKTRHVPHRVSLEKPLQPTVSTKADSTVTTAVDPLATQVLKPQVHDLVEIYNSNLEQLDEEVARQLQLSLLTEPTNENAPQWMVEATDYQVAVQLHLDEQYFKNKTEEDIYSELETEIYKRSIASFNEHKLDGEMKEYKAFYEECVKQKERELAEAQAREAELAQADDLVDDDFFLDDYDEDDEDDESIEDYSDDSAVWDDVW